MTGYDQLTRIARVVALASVVAGCASGVPDGTTPALGGSGLEAANGLSPNGLLRNGLLRNGLLRNGLTENGLLRNGLTTPEFQSWFDEDPVTSDAVMRYLVRCAAPAGESLTYLSPTTGVAHAWTGVLGLAPGFASGLAPTEAEQQVVSACLAAHVNKFGEHVEISVLGQSVTGESIPIEENELSDFSVREACFFGNLFQDQAIQAGIDHAPWSEAYSSVRGCALDVMQLGPNADCPPIENVGKCKAACDLDATGTYYVSCWNWKQVTTEWTSYLPITTRIRPADVYRCGDGVCQLTEHCGTDATAASCLADCGACPATPVDTPPTNQPPEPKNL